MIKKIAKALLRLLRYLKSLPFRLRYRKIFVFGENCIIRNCKVHNPQNVKIVVGNNVNLNFCSFFFETGVHKIAIGIIANSIQLVLFCDLEAKI